MHGLLVALLSHQSATIVAVLNGTSDTLLAVQIGDVIFTAEFSSSELRGEKCSNDEQVRAEVKHGTMRVRGRGGKTVEVPVHWGSTDFGPTQYPALISKFYFRLCWFDALI